MFANGSSFSTFTGFMWSSWMLQKTVATNTNSLTRKISIKQKKQAQTKDHPSKNVQLLRVQAENDHYTEKDVVETICYNGRKTFPVHKNISKSAQITQTLPKASFIPPSSNFYFVELYLTSTTSKDIFE